MATLLEDVKGDEVFFVLGCGGCAQGSGTGGPAEVAAMAKFMSKCVTGLFVPDALIDEIAKVGRDDRRKKSAEIAGRLVTQMRGMCRGVHLMPLGWCSLVPDVLAAVGL